MSNQKAKKNGDKNGSSRKSRRNQRDSEVDSDFGDSDETSSPRFMQTLLQLVLKVTDVLNSNSELKDRIKELEISNADLLQRIETLESDSNTWKNPSQPAHMKVPVPDMVALTSSVADELQDRKDKTDNLVIQGLPEIESDNETEQTNSVVGLFNSIGVVNPIVKRAFRMGRRSNDRPRPIKVFCGNTDTKESVLMKAKSLSRLPEGHKHKNVFIRHDLTKLQRDQEYNRRKERRRERESLPNNQHQRHYGHTRNAQSHNNNAPRRHEFLADPERQETATDLNISATSSTTD